MAARAGRLCRGALLPALRRALGAPPASWTPRSRGVTSALPPGGPAAPPWEAPEAEPRVRAADQCLQRFNIDVLVALLRQENGKDICVIRVPLEMKYTDYFVIVSASSTRHLHAMAQYTLKVYKHLKAQKGPQVQIEGKDTDDWMCIDFGNIVVHFMLPETRETYELEKLWTLRSYDDQLAAIAPETVPEDFILGLITQQKSLEDGVQHSIDN